MKTTRMIPALNVEEKLQLRIYGEPSHARALPTLVYLPGMHGDWTLIGGFRKAVLGHVRFVEMTYPRATAGSLDDQAAQIEDALLQNGISRGWLLGESFGSQLVWALLARGKFQAQGVILAGGFVRHPAHRFMRLMEKFSGVISWRIFVKIIFGYAKYSKYRYKDSPETLASLDEFIARRSPEDKAAAQYRLHLVSRYDPRPIAMNTRIPVYALNGFLDPLIPWPMVRRWLKKHCPGFRDFKVIRRADHNVLNTGIRESAKWVLEWTGAPAAGGALPVDDSPERAKINPTS